MLNICYFQCIPYTRTLISGYMDSILDSPGHYCENCENIIHEDLGFLSNEGIVSHYD